MKKIKTWMLVVTCIIFGVLCFGANMLYRWKVDFFFEKDIHFIEWIFTSQSIDIIMNAVADFGVSLISSAVFLVCVDFVLERSERKNAQELEFQQKRFIISREMRTNPDKILQILKNTGEIKQDLFTNQFFGGCDFSNLDLDGVDFSGSNLANVNFENASLIGTNFKDCIMNQVILHNAKLSFANFTNTNLIDGDFELAYSLWHAVLPNGQEYDGKYMLTGDVQEAQKYGFDIVNDELQKKDFFIMRH